MAELVIFHILLSGRQSRFFDIYHGLVEKVSNALSLVVYGM